MTDEDSGHVMDSDTSETRELTVSRVVEAPPERVYRAFVDPDELVRWEAALGNLAELLEGDE